MRALPNWLDSYLSYTKNTEPKESYRTWCGLSAIASALQRKCYLVNGSETFYPNLYVVLVGPPAARKGTAMRPATEFLKELGIPLAADEASRQKLVNNLEDAYNNHTAPDGTFYMHSSLTILASELTVFLGYQNIDFLSVLCKWYDCEDRFEYDTHAHGKIEVSNIWVNLLGATTPMMVQASLPVTAVGSGFASRTVFVYEDTKAGWIPRPHYDQSLYEPLRRDLYAIRDLCGQFTCSNEFFAAYDPWYAGGASWRGFTEPRLEFYVQRRHVQLLKLSMLYSAARSDDMVITRADFDDSLRTLEAAERRMSNTFRGFGANPLASVQMQVMKILAEYKKVPYKALMNAVCEDTDTKGLSTVIATLEDMGYCKMDLTNKVIVYTRKERHSE